MPKAEEFALANIARVDLEYKENDSTVTLSLTDVAEEAENIAYISEGAENVKRIKNTIKAQNNFEDIVLGYDIKFVNATFIPAVLALVDGGDLTENQGKFEKYEAPKLGVPVERQEFKTKVYTEIKDVDGKTLGYICFVYDNCKGTPVDYRLQDGEFFAPELNIKSRANVEGRPVSVEYHDELPS